MKIQASLNFAGKTPKIKPCGKSREQILKPLGKPTFLPTPESMASGSKPKGMKNDTGHDILDQFQIGAEPETLYKKQKRN